MCLREWLCLWLGREFRAGEGRGVSVAGEISVITESEAESLAWARSRWLPELLAQAASRLPEAYSGSQQHASALCSFQTVPIQPPHSLCFSSQSAEFPKKATSLAGWWGRGGVLGGCVYP